MYATLNVLNDEANKLTQLVKSKLNLLNLPVNILPAKDVKDLKFAFKNFTTKFSSEYKKFLDDKEQKLNSNKKFDEEDMKMEEYIESIRVKDEQINNDIEFLSREFDKIYQAELEYIKRNKLYESSTPSRSQSSGSSDSRSNAGDNDIVIINKVFLNTIVTSNDMNILRHKTSIEDEKNYIFELLKIKELFSTSISKQSIFLDFFMDITSFCVKHRFSIQQMSVIFSIFYFMFLYSFTKSGVNYEKSKDLFNKILDYHSENRPPFSYGIFNAEEKKILKNFGENTLYRNYSIFESIFQFEISICFFSIPPNKMPHEELPKTENYKIKEEMLKPTDDLPQIMKDALDNADRDIDDGEEKEEEKKNDNEINDDELEEQRKMAELKEFMESFYNSAVEYDDLKRKKQEELERSIKDREGNHVRQLMDEKIGEINKDVDEKVNLLNKPAFEAVDQYLSEKNNPKKK